MKVVVAVLGVPRSGTSMTAAILHHLGVSMGEDLAAADCWCPRGWYEDRQFLTMHRALAHPHKDLNRLIAGLPAERPDLNERQKALYRRVVASRCRAGDTWGVKDPRLCFLIDHLAEALHGLAELRIVATRRPAEDSMMSLMRMFGMMRGDADRVVNDYRRRLNAVLKAARYPTIEVDYDEAIENPTSLPPRLATFAGRPMTAAAMCVVDPSLRRVGRLAGYV